MPQTDRPVIIVGAGWAGLAAAVELSRYKIPVIVLESAKQIGGRARRVPFNFTAPIADPIVDSADPATPAATNTSYSISVDNGQHLLFGAYESTLSLLRTIDVKEENVFKRV
ncbi:MAG: NAD(P)-binding protein, partial [Gammaproteobacteria bacterium]